MNKFSIIVPTLNSYLLLSNLVNSIKNQTWQKWEVIFIDGGSNQKHIDYLKEISCKEKRFTFYLQKKDKKGIFGAMNQGLEIIDKNSWIMFLGSDDKFMNNFVLEKLNKEINKLSLQNQDLIICRGRYFDGRKNIFTRYAYFLNHKNPYFLNTEEYTKFIFNGFTPPHQTTLFNGFSDVIFNFYKDNYSIAGDLEFFCRISRNKNLNLVSLPIETIKIYHGGISNTKHIKRMKEVIKCYLNHFKLYFLWPLIYRYIKKIRQSI